MLLAGSADEAVEKPGSQVSSTALVHYRSYDYSVPTAYCFEDVVAKGFVDADVIPCRGEEIARNPLCYGEGVFDSKPLHYLSLIEIKTHCTRPDGGAAGLDTARGLPASAPSPGGAHGQPRQA